jgi:predicted DNA binding protein
MGSNMWICKLKWKHDCIIGNRCEKYNVKVIGYPIDFYEEDFKVKGKKIKKYYYLHFERIYGEEKQIKKFFADFKKDKKLKHLEIEGNMFFFAYEVNLYDVPTSHYSKKTFFLKPIIVDEKGYEYWEIASWNKQNLMDFIKETKSKIKDMIEFNILKIEKTKLSEIYFPQILPDLSPGQRKALELASEEGYFNYPRKTELRDLAKIMGVSLSTYREHLRKAEGKIIPSLKENV